MPEPLTQSLVASGRLSPDGAEEALERQVLMGGALDTALFELGLVDEQAVLEALQDAYGLEVARPQEASRPVDGRALRALPEQWARKHRLAPLSIEDDGRTLSVLTPAPADVQLVVRFAELLETTLRPVLAPEFRVEERLALLYGYEPDERHRALIAGFGGRLPSLGPAAAEHDLDFSAAVARLRDPKSRDHVARTTLRHVGRKLDFTALFMVQDGFLEGWMARGEGSENIPGASIPVDPDSAFRVVLDTSAHYLGPLAVDASHDTFLRSLGRPHPRSVLIVPLRIRERTVALLYGENGPREIPTRMAADVMLFVSHVQAALLTLLLRRKASTLAELPASESMDTLLPPSLAPQPESLPTPPLADDPASAEAALFDADSVDEGSLDPSEPLIAMHLADLAARTPPAEPDDIAVEDPIEPYVPGEEASGVASALEGVELEQVSVDLEEPTLEPGAHPTPALAEDEPLEVELRGDDLASSSSPPPAAPFETSPAAANLLGPAGLDTPARLEEEAETLEPLTSFIDTDRLANEPEVSRGDALTPRALLEDNLFPGTGPLAEGPELGEGELPRFATPSPSLDIPSELPAEPSLDLEGAPEAPPPLDQPQLLVPVDLEARGPDILEPEELSGPVEEAGNPELREEVVEPTTDRDERLAAPDVGAEADGWADVEPEAPLASVSAPEGSGWSPIVTAAPQRPVTIDVPLSALSVTEDGEPASEEEGDEVETDPRLELGTTGSLDLNTGELDVPSTQDVVSDSADVVGEVSRRLDN
ncbi:MAG: hypothetical protein AAFU79_00275, partial [Myxococcota bacterium]